MGRVYGGRKSHIGTLTATSTKNNSMSMLVPSRCIFTCCLPLVSGREFPAPSIIAKLDFFTLFRKF